MYRKYIKQTLDFIFALIALLFFMPLLILISLILVFSNRGNPFFAQSRPGKKEKLFKIYKFRTMAMRYDAEGQLLDDEERVTTIGRIMRKTFLDELPQLINVLKGEMSLIGPRPLLVEYLALYTEKQKKRHLVRPGITGWAQVKDEDTMTWERKFEHDIWYVENHNFKLDMKIVVLTIKKVLSIESVRTSDKIKMNRFKGSN